MKQLVETYPVTTLVLVVLLMLFCSFPYLELSIMEARNFITAREMLSDGNWLLTTMNGEPRYQKPPLPTWFAAISAALLGLKSLFAYRVPGILMVAILTVTAYKFSKTILAHKVHAFVNALILLTSFYVVAIVIEAPWDIFAHGFMFIGIFQLFLLFEKSDRLWQRSFLAGLFIGCSILSKGPVSPYALLIPFLFAYAMTFKFKNFKSKALPLLATVVLAIMIGGWWYLYIRVNDPETFLAIAEKETGNWSSYNVRPWYYYWSFFTQSGIWTIPAFIALLYPYLKSRVRHLKAYQFTLLWTLIAVILLSVIPEKKSRYLMPVLIPLALNTGFYIDYLFRRFSALRDKRETIPVYFNFGLIAVIAMGFCLGGYLYLKEMTSVNWLRFAMTSIVFFVIGFRLIGYLFKKQMKQVFLLTVGFVVAAFILVPPLTVNLKNENYNNISSLGATTADTGSDVYSLGQMAPEMIWHFGRKIKSIDLEDINLELQDVKQFGLLIKSADTLLLESLNANYSLEKKATYDLNIASPNSRQYRSRLVNHYYLVDKK